MFIVTTTLRYVVSGLLFVPHWVVSMFVWLHSPAIGARRFTQISLSQMIQSHTHLLSRNEFQVQLWWIIWSADILMIGWLYWETWSFCCCFMTFNKLHKNRWWLMIMKTRSWVSVGFQGSLVFLLYMNEKKRFLEVILDDLWYTKTTALNCDHNDYECGKKRLRNSKAISSSAVFQFNSSWYSWTNTSCYSQLPRGRGNVFRSLMWSVRSPK